MPSAQLESMLSQWDSDTTLFASNQFARRAEVQDEMEHLLGVAALDSHLEHDLIRRARALQAKLESINNHLFASIRCEIQAGRCPAEFTSILHGLATPPRGLAYTFLDDLLTGVFQFDPPAQEARPLTPDSVFYQPTPARHIFRLISAAAITRADTLIDLGSGLGHVPLLVSICTGATSIGIELDPTWIASARSCADQLGLSSVSFVTQDAREANLSDGSVFYLYTPFTGLTLARILDSLRTQAKSHPIRICSFGPCTVTIAQQPWLHPSSPPDSEQLTVFHSVS